MMDVIREQPSPNCQTINIHTELYICFNTMRVIQQNKLEVTVYCIL